MSTLFWCLISCNTGNLTFNVLCPISAAQQWILLLSQLHMKSLNSVIWWPLVTVHNNISMCSEFSWILSVCIQGFQSSCIQKKDEMLVQEKQNFDTCDFNDVKVIFALFLSPKSLLECTGCPLLLHTLSSSHMCFGSLVPVVCLCLYQKLKSPFTLCLTPAALNRSRPKQCRKSFPWSLW